MSNLQKIKNMIPIEDSTIDNINMRFKRKNTKVVAKKGSFKLAKSSENSANMSPD